VVSVPVAGLCDSNQSKIQRATKEKGCFALRCWFVTLSSFLLMEGRCEGNGRVRERKRKPRQRREGGGGSLPARPRWPGSTVAAAGDSEEVAGVEAAVEGRTGCARAAGWGGCVLR
jgi:hypothetical protein